MFGHALYLAALLMVAAATATAPATTAAATAKPQCDIKKRGCQGFHANFYRYDLRSENGWTPDFFTNGYKDGGLVATTSGVIHTGFRIRSPDRQIVYGRIYNTKITVSNFSLEQTGFFTPPSTGTYEFTIKADNGVSLQISPGLTCCNRPDGDKYGGYEMSVIDNEGGGGSLDKITKTGSFHLEAGVHYFIRVVSFNWQGNCGLGVFFKSPGSALERVLGHHVYQHRYDTAPCPPDKLPAAGMAAGQDIVPLEMENAPAGEEAVTVTEETLKGVYLTDETAASQTEQESDNKSSGTNTVAFEVSKFSSVADESASVGATDVPTTTAWERDFSTTEEPSDEMEPPIETSTMLLTLTTTNEAGQTITITDCTSQTSGAFAPTAQNGPPDEKQLALAEQGLVSPGPLMRGAEDLVGKAPGTGKNRPSEHVEGTEVTYVNFLEGTALPDDKKPSKYRGSIVSDEDRFSYERNRASGSSKEQKSATGEAHPVVEQFVNGCEAVHVASVVYTLVLAFFAVAAL